MHFPVFFLPENLVISKKSSTFALAFEKWHPSAKDERITE